MAGNPEKSGINVRDLFLEILYQKRPDGVEPNDLLDVYISTTKEKKSETKESYQKVINDIETDLKTLQKAFSFVKSKTVDGREAWCWAPEKHKPNARKLSIIKKLYDKRPEIVEPKDLLDVYKAHEFLITKKIHKKTKTIHKKTTLEDDVERNQRVIRDIGLDCEDVHEILPFVKSKTVGGKKGWCWAEDNYRCWYRGNIGEKMAASENSNKALAELAVKELKKMKFGSLLIGKGSSCWQVGKLLLEKEIKINTLYTGNLAFFCEVVRQWPDNLTVYLPYGKVDHLGGYYDNITKCEIFKEPPVDVVITSFLSICEMNGSDAEGKKIVFGGNADLEAADKCMNLDPSGACKNVLIVVNKEKLAITDTKVACQDNLVKNIQYTIVTDLEDRNRGNKDKWSVLETFKNIPDRKTGYVTLAKNS